MSDLRAKVEALPWTPQDRFRHVHYGDSRFLVDRAAVLDLIPEGAVLVTEDRLADMHWLLVAEVNRTDEAYLDLLDWLEPLFTVDAAERADAKLREAE